MLGLSVAEEACAHESERVAMPRCSEELESLHKMADLRLWVRAGELAHWLAVAERHDCGECAHLQCEID